RSTSSIHSQTDSPSTSPPQHNHKKQKHVVSTGRTHARIPSNRSFSKLTKAHGNDSHTDLKKLPRNSSASSLKKNNSHTNLKRNRSLADVPKRPKSSHGPDKRPASVHFQIGEQDQDDEDGEEEWEEASSASPALSRSATRSAASSNHSSAKPSANNSQPQSPPQSPPPIEQLSNGGTEKQSARHPPADAKVITERLLQRSNSQHTTTTKMSLATATPDRHSPDSLEKSQNSTLNGTTFNGTPKTGSSNNEVVSRFVGGSGTPSEASPFLQNRKPSTSTADDSPHKKNEEVKRAQSMGNLARHNSSADDDSESALLPRSRKSSQSHAYVPPQQSRTQQKLWLQRASSNIEPQQMAPGLAINGVHSGLGAGVGTSLVGAGYDGRDPRIKQQLERTGLEYLVVRRHQDPVGQALKRLSVLPGVERNRRIPPSSSSQANKKGDTGEGSGSVGRYGLSQSLKEGRANRNGKDRVTNGARSSYEGHEGSQDERGLSGRANDDEGVGAILRSLWEKSFDLSASAD
ncbi:hypothetical protein L207DRAFT_378066, partial [Hyaloscypha variabilis F]